MQLGISIHAPRAGGDEKIPPDVMADVDFNPRPPCGGRQVARRAHTRIINISIHAPRAGGDLRRRLMSNMAKAFQSTPPVRGATISGRRMLPLDFYFNPRPPCGGRLQR